MIGRLHHVVVDCPDPLALARFYSELLSLPITYVSDEFAVVSRDETTSGVAFQRVSDYVAPRWPESQHPQQMHFDVMTEDVEGASVAAVAIGAQALDERNHVMADPAGHPFCFVPRPDWAVPLD